MGSTSKLLVILKEVQKGQNPCTQGEYKWRAKLKKKEEAEEVNVQKLFNGSLKCLETLESQ